MDYLLTLVGLLGFLLVGRKIWWAWYINLANQVIWATYAIITRQWGFLIGVAFYVIVFGLNAYRWTIDRPDREASNEKRPPIR